MNCGDLVCPWSKIMGFSDLMVGEIGTPTIKSDFNN